MLLAPLLVLIVHLLQHLLDGVDHQHEVYPSLRSPASTKAVVRVEADGQRLAGGLDEHRIVLQTALSQQFQIAPPVRLCELLVDGVVADELPGVEAGMRNVDIDAVAIGVGHERRQLDGNLRVRQAARRDGVGHPTALAEEGADEGNGEIATHHALVALQREGERGGGHRLELEPPARVEVDAGCGGEYTLAHVVHGRGGGLEQSVEGGGLLLEHDDDRAHVDARRTTPHAPYRLLHVLRALRQTEHARVHRVVQVATTQLQQHRLAVHEGARRLQLRRNGRQGHVLLVGRCLGGLLLHQHALTHHEQRLRLIACLYAHVGVTPYPHEQVVAHLLVQRRAVLQLVQLHRAVCASLMHHSPTLSVEHHEGHVHHLQPLHREGSRVLAFALRRLLHHAHRLRFTRRAAATWISLEFCALTNMYT